MTIKKQASDLKGDLRQIRRMHQLSKESLQESIHETMKKIAVSFETEKLVIYAWMKFTLVTVSWKLRKLPPRVW